MRRRSKESNSAADDSLEESSDDSVEPSGRRSTRSSTKQANDTKFADALLSLGAMFSMDEPPIRPVKNKEDESDEDSDVYDDDYKDKSLLNDVTALVDLNQADTIPTENIKGKKGKKKNKPTVSVSSPSSHASDIDVSSPRMTTRQQVLFLKKATEEEQPNKNEHDYDLYIDSNPSAPVTHHIKHIGVMDSDEELSDTENTKSSRQLDQVYNQDEVAESDDESKTQEERNVMHRVEIKELLSAAAAMSAAAALNSTFEASSQAPTPKTRGRGRGSSNAVGRGRGRGGRKKRGTTGRGPGRPRKKPLEQEVESESSSNDDKTDESDAASSSSPAPSSPVRTSPTNKTSPTPSHPSLPVTSNEPSTPSSTTLPDDLTQTSTPIIKKEYIWLHCAKLSINFCGEYVGHFDVLYCKDALCIGDIGELAPLMKLFREYSNINICHRIPLDTLDDVLSNQESLYKLSLEKIQSTSNDPSSSSSTTNKSLDTLYETLHRDNMVGVSYLNDACMLLLLPSSSHITKDLDKAMVAALFDVRDHQDYKSSQQESSSNQDQSQSQQASSSSSIYDQLLMNENGNQNHDQNKDLQPSSSIPYFYHQDAYRPVTSYAPSTNSQMAAPPPPMGAPPPASSSQDNVVDMISNRLHLSSEQIASLLNQVMSNSQLTNANNNNASSNIPQYDPNQQYQPLPSSQPTSNSIQPGYGAVPPTSSSTNSSPYMNGSNVGSGQPQNGSMYHSTSSSYMQPPPMINPPQSYLLDAPISIPNMSNLNIPPPPPPIAPNQRSSSYEESSPPPPPRNDDNNNRYHYHPYQRNNNNRSISPPSNNHNNNNRWSNKSNNRGEYGRNSYSRDEDDRKSPMRRNHKSSSNQQPTRHLRISVPNDELMPSYHVVHSDFQRHGRIDDIQFDQDERLVYVTYRLAEEADLAKHRISHSRRLYDMVDFCDGVNNQQLLQVVKDKSPPPVLVKSGNEHVVANTTPPPMSMDKNQRSDDSSSPPPTPPPPYLVELI